MDDLKSSPSTAEVVGSKSRRKLDPVDPELAVTTMPPETTAAAAETSTSESRERRQADSGAASGQNVVLLRWDEAA